MKLTFRVLFLSFAPFLAMGGPIGLARIGPLVERADLIIVGEAAQGYQSGTNAAVVLNVLRTLKGAPRTSTVSASITVSEEFSASRELRGMKGLWFLREEGGGGYRLMPVMMGSIPLEYAILPALASLPGSWAGASSAGPLDRVLRELAAASVEAAPAVSPLILELLAQAP